MKLSVQEPTRDILTFYGHVLFFEVLEPVFQIASTTVILSALDLKSLEGHFHRYVHELRLNLT